MLFIVPGIIINNKVYSWIKFSVNVSFFPVSRSVLNINTVYCMRIFCRYSPELFLSPPVGLIHCSSYIFTVDLLLKAVGDTPIMKQKKWAVERGRTVQSLSQFISRFLKLDAGEQLVRMKLVGFTKEQKSDHTTSPLYIFIFSPHSSFMLTNHSPLHLTRTLASFLMWVLTVIYI